MRSEQRLEDVQSQIDSNKRHITLSHLPYETYLFEITPADEADLTSFKEFHHISENIHLKYCRLKIKENDDKGEER